MKKKLLLLTIVTANALIIKAQTNKTYFLGHSLVNSNMPNMVNKLSIAGSQVFSYNYGVTNGAGLQYHWNNMAIEGSPWQTVLPIGGFENFIVTEAVPLLNHLQWSNTYNMADSLYQFAKLYNPTIQYYLYETWHCNTTGTTLGCPYDGDDALLWRPRLTADLPKWEGIADTINARHTDDMLVIPAGQALAQLCDSITANKVPGFTSINELFSDDIHLTNVGNYFIACVMYGVIHNTSPEGLPNQLTDEWSTPYADFPTITQAGIFQRIAWRTLCAYPRDGVNCLTTSASETGLPTSDNYIIFPNPAKEKITVSGSEKISRIEIYNVLGEIIYQHIVANTAIEIDISNLAKGIYYVKINTGQNSYNKKVVIE